MKRKTLLTLLVLIAFLFSTSCILFAGAEKKSAEETAGVMEVHDIAIMPFHIPCMWFSPFTAGGYWYLQQKGHNVRTANAAWDTKQMNTILNTWAEDPKLEGVIIAPLGGEEVLPGIRALKAAGKVVVLSNNEAGYCPEADFCVRFDSPTGCYDGAMEAVKMLKAKKGEAKGVVILGLGDVRNSEHLERAAGARKAFQQFPKIEIHEFVSDMDAGKAVTETGTLLRTLPQVDVLFSVGMLEFMGMINALKREEMAFPKDDSRHIICVGMDSCPDVINPAVKEGIVDFVIDQPVLSYNALAAFYLLKILDNGGNTGVLPKPGTTIRPADVDIKSKVPQKGLDITVPADAWAPAEVLDTMDQFGHIWIKTNYRIIDDANVDDPTLWSNITGQVRDYGF
jgi:ABC-type sugar transport system substrate-binding protein